MTKIHEFLSLYGHLLLAVDFLCDLAWLIIVGRFDCFIKIEAASLNFFILLQKKVQIFRLFVGF